MLDPAACAHAKRDVLNDQPDRCDDCGAPLPPCLHPRRISLTISLDRCDDCGETFPLGRLARWWRYRRGARVLRAIHRG